MGQLPVLASGATKIAPVTSQGQPKAARIIMEHGLFFDGRDGQGGYLAVDERIDFPFLIHPCMAIPVFAFRDDALAGTDMTASLARSEGFV